jgi:hypothetical protein
MGGFGGSADSSRDVDQTIWVSLTTKTWKKPLTRAMVIIYILAEVIYLHYNSLPIHVILFSYFYFAS